MCRLNRRWLAAVAVTLLLGACGGGRFATDYGAGYYASRPLQCVPYARSKSGLQLYGDAYSWWDQAADRYLRSNCPLPGAVLVLAQTPRMTHGHVAVVTGMLDARHINVTHSNWGSDMTNRRIVYDFVRVEDVSAANDWTSVRFWNRATGAFGFPYAALGFIYPH